MSRRAGNWQASEGSFRRQHPSCSIPKGTSCYKKGLGPGRPLRSRWRAIWLRSWGQSISLKNSDCRREMPCIEETQDSTIWNSCMWHVVGRWSGILTYYPYQGEKNMGHLNTVHPGWAGSSGSHLAERAGSSQRGRPWVLDIPKGTATTGTTQKHNRKGLHYHILQWFPTRVGFTIHNPTLFWEGCCR